MTAFVLDASVAVAWCVDDEASALTDALLVRAGDGGIVVPPHWHLEVLNVLLMAEKRGRLQNGAAAIRLQTFAKIQIAVDDEMAALAWTRVREIAQGDNLTAYDAAYLELASRSALPLATLDRALADAARRAGVALLLGMLAVRPLPFVVLDEVDAALDEANVTRFGDAIRELSERTQVVVITHNRGTVEVADSLWGVTVGEDAASRVFGLRLDEAKRIADQARAEREAAR